MCKTSWCVNFITATLFRRLKHIEISIIDQEGSTFLLTILLIQMTMTLKANVTHCLQFFRSLLIQYVLIGCFQIISMNRRVGYVINDVQIGHDIQEV